MYYNIPLFHLFVLLFLSTGFLAQHWYAIGRRFRKVDADADNSTENQWTLVPRGLDRSSPMVGKEERAVSKREALRAIFSKAFLANVTLCAIATTSLIISVLNFAFVHWISRSYHSFENKYYLTRLEHAFERLTNNDAGMKWAQLSGPVGSAAFGMSYYLAFFGGLIFWFFAMRRVYQLLRRMVAKATLCDLHATMQVLYQNLKSDREFCLSLLGALISTLVWWYLDRWAGMVIDNDPYEVLGLTLPVTLQDIQGAYYIQSMVYRDYCDFIGHSRGVLHPINGVP